MKGYYTRVVVHLYYPCSDDIVVTLIVILLLTRPMPGIHYNLGRKIIYLGIYQEGPSRA